MAYEIMKKVLIVRILMALLHFFKRPPLSNGLQSDLETRAVHSLLLMALLHFLKRPNGLQSDLETKTVHSLLVVDYGHAL